jgi:uncharacterized protein
MSNPHLIHPDRLTPAGTPFQGTLRPGDLPRLAPELANPEGELRYRLTARLDSQQRRVVSCIIDGFVFLTCQSTMEVFRHEIAVRDRLVLVGSEQELPPIEGEGDEEDFVVATDPLDPVGLVEDAVLLALPMVPRKPGAGPGAEGEEVGSGKPSPFAALAGLKAPR